LEDISTSCCKQKSIY